ncbi:NucA/NucB deoxyribonuclease domain-containing protein [Streptomyces iconiensis]|uniref:Deoxyribonuclease NucA/NucB domain-containing protein n=1 Tax=Streptomyces iconiensis TaxID=1384038 RepID=A0ABT7A264_9ACTN|nr:hypothetical protein [Streptomyces iconiensis]MDJ1135396.1 hypothetical protein [Streptomyces iconiensis]
MEARHQDHDRPTRRGPRLGARQDALEKEAAEHIKRAYTSPGSTTPKNPKKDIPGSTAKRPLTRLFEEKRREANRNLSIKTCKDTWGKDYSEGGKYECDEFPPSSTYQGSAQPRYDKNAPADNYSVLPIPADDNNRGGKIIAGFYQKNRIIDGSDDGFTVSVK